MLVVIIVIVSLLYVVITMVGDEGTVIFEKDEKTAWNINAKENIYALTFENGPYKK